jgi:plastocyanin
MHRRDFLRSAGTVVVTLGGGCAGRPDGGDNDRPTTTEARTATATRTPTPTRATTAEPTPSPTPRSGSVTVDVGPGRSFRPATVRIRAGTTVRWIWRTDSHNVIVDSQPGAADWAGHRALEDAEFEYRFTFTVPGTYRYYCEPHRRDGMTGVVHVH